MLGSSLDFLGMPQARQRCLKAYCEAYLAEEDFFGGDTSAVVARLLGVRGIGPWTASYIALRALRDPDAFPAEDVALARGLMQPGGARPTRDALEQRSQAWRPWRAYAAQHIWTELASG
jgi:AraC family transcriptional regulator of adaptative response / DNA-3-methyladenine glycosylase II